MLANGIFYLTTLNSNLFIQKMLRASNDLNQEIELSNHRWLIFYIRLNVVEIQDG